MKYGSINPDHESIALTEPRPEGLRMDTVKDCDPQIRTSTADKKKILNIRRVRRLRRFRF